MDTRKNKRPLFYNVGCPRGPNKIDFSFNSLMHKSDKQVIGVAAFLTTDLCVHQNVCTLGIIYLLPLSYLQFKYWAYLQDNRRETNAAWPGK